MASKPQKPITLKTWRDASRFLAKSLRLLQQALIEGKLLFKTASFHGALLHSAGGRREQPGVLITDKSHDPGIVRPSMQEKQSTSTHNAN
ncbi:hypothetical protein [Bradyrhizobium sp. McL0615]|uniref:hypothetical protein n=1 Tax=Bradyrhizobium sp. McL0615 TaxID=3415673 RepID=UPI003CF2FFF1